MQLIIPQSFLKKINMEKTLWIHFVMWNTLCEFSDSFEDKRRENFEKGQAELERRRKALLDAQRRETEERLRR